MVAALKSVRPGGTVAVNAIHLDRVPQFDYDDLWWERSIRSVANVTRADVCEFLIRGPAGVTTEPRCSRRQELPLRWKRVAAGDVDGSCVLVP